MLSIERIAALLRQTMGLDAESIGTSAVESAVRERMGALGLEHLRTYWERINRSPAELQALVETIVVPET
jgi:chemotaxis protein methyltransferase WspC